MFHNATTYYIYSFSYVGVSIRWFSTDGFKFFFPILYFLLVLLIFLFCTIGGIIFLIFFRICSNYVNVTFIFSKIVMKRPMNGILGSIIVSFSVFSAGVSLISILFFLGDFADGRSLHDAEVQSSMDLNFIFSKVLTT